MKNIIKVALLLLMAVGAVSCNLNKYPSSAIVADEGFLTYDDASKFRNGMYYFVRQCFSSYSILPVNIQAEGVNPTLDYGNMYGYYYTWNFRDNEGEVEQLWAYCYIAIGKINYFIEHTNILLKENDEKVANGETGFTEEELANLNYYLGEAYCLRAMVNNQLVTNYCKAYNPATAETDLGIILTDTFDFTVTKARDTMAKTYEKIMEDIGLAETALQAALGESHIENFVDIWTVRALKSKVLLAMHEYTDAANLAVQLVNRFPLISDQSSFKDMWQYDQGSEIIFQFYASNQEGRTPMGAIFLNDPNNNGAVLDPYYLPSQWMLDQYTNTDIRFRTYFERRNIRIGSTAYNLYVVSKYPGNPAYNTQTGINEFMQNVRPFRSGDFALIAAEGFAMGGDETQANTWLKNLRAARIPDYEHTDLSGEELMDAIKLERLKELFMEGNRLYDLKRWGEPMNRLGHSPQDDEAVISAGIDLVIEPTDYRFVWPIPQSEYMNNHNLDGQLNWK